MIYYFLLLVTRRTCENENDIPQRYAVNFIA